MYIEGILNNIKRDNIKKYKINYINYTDYIYDSYIIRIYLNKNKILILYEEGNNIEVNDLNIINIFKDCLSHNTLVYNSKNILLNKENKDFIISYQKIRLKKLIYIYFKDITFKEIPNDHYFEYIIWEYDIIYGRCKTLTILLNNKLFYKIIWIDKNKNERKTIYYDFNVFLSDFENNIFNKTYRTLSGNIINK